ncbi:MAG: type II secretion system GspH family protein [Fusobacterium sp.]|nr:type II secretion system GspH family protein [Fusobacterium sp.]
MKNKLMYTLTGGGGPLLGAFTMAEILLSLTIIGVVAAITLPSLTGNINERTWNTQRKALYARMSQAIALMPALNGYGTFAAATASSSAVDNVAETFITSGLSKVFKINNICDNSNLKDCGLPSEFIDGGGSKQSLPVEIKDLNPGIITVVGAVSVKNTKAAAFETANGESILTFYNPNCTAENNEVVLYDGSQPAWVVKQQVCVNFVYDLNGNKGPNTFGKDIGTMSVMYSSDSKVVMPLAPRAVTGRMSQDLASAACRKLDDGQYRLPNIEEVLAVYYNRLIYSNSAFGSNSKVWTSTTIDANNVYTFGFDWGRKFETAKNGVEGVFCLKR